MNVLCIGFGFVGKAYALYLKEAGHIVHVVTKDKKTNDAAKNYGFSSPETENVYDAAIIAVPTPSTETGFDISTLEEAIRTTITMFNPKNIIIKSTIIPGTSKKLSTKFPNTEFYFYPEFLEAKNPIGGVFNQKIIVFGNDIWDKTKIDFIKELFNLKEIQTTNYETAETLKYTHNLWLACNISFWNSIKNTIDENVDINFILRELHKSEYFGTHPWKVGNAFDGECLPKDLHAYIKNIKIESTYKDFIESIEKVNQTTNKKSKI